MAAGPICGLSVPTESRAPLILIGLIQIMLQDLFPTSNPHISYSSPCTLRREKRGRKWTFILLRVFIQSFAIKTDRYPRLSYSMGMKGRVSRSSERTRAENVKKSRLLWRISSEGDLSSPVGGDTCVKSKQFFGRDQSNR